MDEIRDAEMREALRDGLREEAAPLSRRLAEVKGLSNNTIRRLERLEGTLESERHARVDDLALLVDLLTDGWRALNARLERIEAMLQATTQPAVPDAPRDGGQQADPPPPGAEVYRLPTAG
jgi:hypothetical protein